MCDAGGGMCVQQVASSTIKVLSAPDTPHFTFDAVVDMSVQQEGVFAGMPPSLMHCCVLLRDRVAYIAVQQKRSHLSSCDVLELIRMLWRDKTCPANTKFIKSQIVHILL